MRKAPIRPKILPAGRQFMLARSQATPPPHARKKRSLWLRVLTVLFFGAVTVLLVSQARKIDWSEVAQVIARFGAPHYSPTVRSAEPA